MTNGKMNRRQRRAAKRPPKFVLINHVHLALMRGVAEGRGFSFDPGTPPAWAKREGISALPWARAMGRLCK